MRQLTSKLARRIREPALFVLAPALGVTLAIAATGYNPAPESEPNTLALAVQPDALFVRPGEPVMLSLDVSNLTQPINGCQALIGYSSAYLTAPHSVAPGGGFWTELIYESWTTPGELDTAIGLQLEGGPAGTQADATVAVITLTAGTTEGPTFLVFRPDLDDKYATLLSDLNAEPLWPFKLDSQPIVIDGTPPVVVDLTARQDGLDMLDCPHQTFRGVLVITVNASDALAGLEGSPAIDISGPQSLVAALVDSEGPVYGWEVVIDEATASGPYTIAITATDRAGNDTVLTGTVCVNSDEDTRNGLVLEVQPDSLFVRPGEPVVLDLDVFNLTRPVNGCQALIGYSSAYLTAPHSVAPGGGFWTELIYESWTTPGELDTAIGLQLEGGPTGTQADATVAIITLTAGTTEGLTSLVFRTDLDDKYATMLSDLNAQPLWPFKIDSLPILIDGTPPVVVNLTAIQNDADVLNCANPTVQGPVTITVDATDALAGLAGAPTIDVSGPQSLTATLIDDTGPVYGWEVTIDGATLQGTYTITITATDRAGNQTVVTGTLCVNWNRITGTVASNTLSGATYSFDRDVVFKATDGSGAVLHTWTIPVTFTNNPVTKVASGSYSLTLVPGATVRLSAKTDYSLRKRMPVTLDPNGQAVTNFTLTCGDLDGSNTANIIDYSALKANWMTAGPAGDFNGDGQVMLLDYSLLKAAWFTAGDPE